MNAAPKEQALVANLSGKKTSIGRNSGECLQIVCRPPKKQATGLSFRETFWFMDRDFSPKAVKSLFLWMKIVLEEW